jgi:hypothetical protein
MSLEILRKTGGWCIELQQPLKTYNGEMAAIEIRPPSADHVIRWAAYEIPSILALLSDLCGVTEKQLRQLSAQDFERVYFALRYVVPSSIRVDIEENKRVLATPEEDIPEDQSIPPPDQSDPRFPDPGGPVVRLTERKPPPSPPPPLPEDQPMNFAPPPVSEVVR